MNETPEGQEGGALEDQRINSFVRCMDKPYRRQVGGYG